MNMKRCLASCAAFALASALGTAWAADHEDRNPQVRQSSAGAAASPGLAWEGWGVRVGFTSGGDQIVAGAHLNLGEIRRNLRFQPDLELGAGDDTTALVGTAPLFYRFDLLSRMTPYAGGGIVLGYFDHDRDPVSPAGDDSEFGIGARATGGLEWDRADGNFFLELSLGFGDVHDVQFVAAWTF